jgi:hypothetical protein
LAQQTPLTHCPVGQQVALAPVPQHEVPAAHGQLLPQQVPDVPAQHVADAPLPQTVLAQQTPLTHWPVGQQVALAPVPQQVSPVPHGQMLPQHAPEVCAQHV